MGDNNGSGILAIYLHDNIDSLGPWDVQAYRQERTNHVARATDAKAAIEFMLSIIDDSTASDRLLAI